MTIIVGKPPHNPCTVTSNDSMNKDVNMHVKFCEELIDKLINRIVINTCGSETLVSMNSLDNSLSTP